MKLSNEKLLETYEDFKVMSFKKLKEKHNLNISYASYWERLKKLGLETTFTKVISKLDDETILKAFELHKNEKLEIEKIAKKFNIHPATLNKHFKRMNLKYIPWLKEKERDQEIIKDYLDGMNVKELSEKYNICESVICRTIYRRQKLNKRKRGLYVNSLFFETIDSEIKAYLLGFLYADGCIEKSSYRVCINIQESDIYVVNLFKQFLCPEAKIKKYHNSKGAINRKPQVIIRISSKELVQSLSKINIKNNKTFDKDFSINFINDDLKIHFIRGFLDGDGWFTSKSSVGFCGLNINLLKEIQMFLEKNNIFLKITKSITKNGYDFYRLASDSKNESLKFGNFIYTNANYFLQRKFDNYNILLSQYRAKQEN